MTPEQQSAVVTEARSWLNTPYQHCAAIKGAGVDCLMLLSAVFHNAGLVPFIDPRPYPTDWMLHHSTERYLLGLGDHCTLLTDADAPEPGDIQMFRFGRTFSHAGIITDWPNMIHAYQPAGRVVLDQVFSAGLENRLGPRYRLEVTQ